MKTTNKITKNFFSNNNYKVCIFDVNSLFLFSGKNSIRLMYDFIANLRKFFPNLLVINVIDNGISKKLLNLYPYYKANRAHSISSNNIMINKFGTINSFKSKISRIHQLDSLFKKNLTFYYTGESDFKVGQILKYINTFTNLDKSEILTVSIDKDFLLTTLLSDFLLKRKINKKNYYYLINRYSDIEKVKKIFNIEKLNITTVDYYFYFLLLNGDRIDNIKQLLTKGQTIKLLNEILEEYKYISIDLIIKYVKNRGISKKQILENCYLVDLFNDDIFSITEKNTMKQILNDFLLTNDINVMI